MAEIGLLNCGGNFASVRNALVHLGVDPIEVAHPETLERTSHLILPGVGSFPGAMKQLHEMQLVEPLREHVVSRQKPFLGICVGMQVLADTGFEFEQTEGLGFIAGQVGQISAAEHNLSVPHIGWNELTIHRDHPLMAHLPPSPSFYFVHSFALQPSDATVTVADCNYGDAITACVQRDNICGVQFHPEKSQRDGLQLLKNFCEFA
ncbi:MAG: imidazole glycerol phosphate synthase subunit HisH [Pirellulaceae bacterium]|jgi:glutamine amidotransferase|nr:imidazole glycerol phosphate synthase subunit HisH [Pirellulaceae bacterium]